MTSTVQTTAIPALEKMLKWEQAGANFRRRRALIKKLCESIARRFQPVKIILFGSYAYGRPKVDSDVDLLVIMPFKDGAYHQAGVILNGIVNEVGYVPIDLLVRTPEQVQERIALGDQFMQEIITRGKVMYEATHTRMG
jgi:predicted nucleotidyltransferase